jgi:phosphoribosyl-ATP pyrophosphohydrolase/phosphoribosyl-AMP cyclohydrolase/histidinol dehydrogenase
VTIDPLLRRIEPRDLSRYRRSSLDQPTIVEAARIVERVQESGESALREYAGRFDGLRPDEPLAVDRKGLESACAAISKETRDLLERTADRIRRFAEAQRACVQDLSLEISGGVAGHTVLPVESAGCYVPGGRNPLVSSMLMTVVTARAAGVGQVWAASPRPGQVMLAAAAIAGADGLLATGGAHAIAALAHGVGPAPRCDVIVGPGNRWVTAAKYVVSRDVRIDMLAGPSELLILADDSADSRLIAADLLAQAEHDTDAVPMLVSTSPDLLIAVERDLALQLAALPTRETAASALQNGFAMCAQNIDEAVTLCNDIAPEHLELHVRDAQFVASRIRRCGCIFVGQATAEVLGDYGAGPNHTLPTGGTAHFASGLSVLSFLRHQTWLRCEMAGDAASLLNDAVSLARLEGLEAHARSVEKRRQPRGSRTASTHVLLGSYPTTAPRPREAPWP